MPRHLQSPKIRGSHTSFTEQAYLVVRAANDHPLVTSITPGNMTSGGGGSKVKLIFRQYTHGRGWSVKVLGGHSIQILHVQLVPANEHRAQPGQEEARVKQYLEAALARDARTMRRLLQNSASS